MEVNLAQTTFSMDAFNGRGTQAAVQLSFLPTSSHTDSLQLCRHALGLKQDFYLQRAISTIVLFAGLYNCIECLQNMKDSDFAFSKYVAPQMDVEEALLARPRAGLRAVPCRISESSFAGLYNCLECLQNMKDLDFALIVNNTYSFITITYVSLANPEPEPEPGPTDATDARSVSSFAGFCSAARRAMQGPARTSTDQYDVDHHGPARRGSARTRRAWTTSTAQHSKIQISSTRCITQHCSRDIPLPC
jgi:hypothetical protein